MMRMIIFATLRGDRAAAGAGNPLIGQIGDQDITGLDRAVRHDHRHQDHDHRHQGHDHRHQVMIIVTKVMIIFTRIMIITIIVMIFLRG